MPSTYILDDRILEALNNLKNKLGTDKLWFSSDYDEFFQDCGDLITFVEKLYCKATGESLRETSRRIHDDTFRDSLEVYINYYNVLLFIRNLEYKIRWHQKYGVFPK